MTKIHDFIICFVFLVVAVCGFSNHCAPNMGKLGDLALVVVGAVGGNAQATMRRKLKTKKKAEGNVK